jgi:hypothetical protein
MTLPSKRAMTVEGLVEMARVLDNDYRFAPPKQCRELARGVLDLLGADFPCGWPKPYDRGQWVDWDVEGNPVMEPDEARGIAVALLKAADSAEARSGESSNG